MTPTDGTNECESYCQQKSALMCILAALSYIFALILFSVCVWIAYAIIFDVRLISFH